MINVSLDLKFVTFLYFKNVTHVGKYGNYGKYLPHGNLGLYSFMVPPHQNMKWQVNFSFWLPIFYDEHFDIPSQIHRCSLYFRCMHGKLQTSFFS
jgi:hypothetical protein